MKSLISQTSPQTAHPASDVRVKDVPSVSAAVSVIERSEHPDHEVRDKAEVISPCRTYDDIIDQYFSHGTLSCDGYDF
jgi:hypothetical protein